MMRGSGSLAVSEARQTAYLLKGKVTPDYDRLEFGMAEKFVLRALASARDVRLPQVETEFRKTGTWATWWRSLPGRDKERGSL